MTKRLSIQSQNDAPKWTAGHDLGLALVLVAIGLVGLLASPVFTMTSWLAILALLTVFTIVAGHGVTGLWYGLLIDGRNKMSLSRLQMLLWTLLVLSGFLAAGLYNIATGHTDPLAIAIPPDLWLLMGISLTSLVGSPLIVNAKKAKPANDEEAHRTLETLKRQVRAKVQVVGQVVVNEQPEDAHWSDMFRGGEAGNAAHLDLGKVQMFIFTLILALAYGAALAALFAEAQGKIAELPGLGSGIVFLLGLSHAGYLANKVLPNGERAVASRS
jgi:hypothetical protein